MSATCLKTKLPLLPWTWLLVTGLLLASCVGQGGIQIEEAWVRSADQGENSAAYFIVSNQGESDQLIDIEYELATEAQLHRSTIDDQGIVRMVQQQRVPIPTDSRVNFEPGGLHVMLMNLTQSLEVGNIATITLIFQKAGSVEIDAEIRNP